MANNDLVNVKTKNGTFYISSKEDKGEGWERQEFKNPQDKDETLVRWHKNVSIEGKVSHLEMKDDKYAGKALSMIVNGENQGYSLMIPIMDTGGTVKTTNQYFNSLVGALENIKKGDKVTMFLNNKNKDKNDRLYRNVVVLDADGKLIKSNFQFSDVPKWNSSESEDEFGEKVTVWDASPTNKFYIDKFKAIVASFNEGSAGSSTPQSKEEQKAPEKSKKAVKETPAGMQRDEDSDLPF